MNVLITGAQGMLAAALLRLTSGLCWNVVGCSRSELDVTDQDEVRSRIRELQPNIVFHCAAYTAVDRAEEEVEQAFLVNETGARFVAEASADAGALMVFPSTDYVFPGTGDRPWLPDDPTNPLSVYGRSKLGGEGAVRGAGGRTLVARTSWLFGEGGPNFVDSMIRLAGSHSRLAVVADQVGRPTWTDDLALALLDLAVAGHQGTVHVANRGQATWRDLAEAAIRLAGSHTPVDPVTTQDYGAKAPRPLYSVLDISDTERLLGRSMPEWRDSLRRYIALSQTHDSP